MPPLIVLLALGAIGAVLYGAMGGGMPSRTNGQNLTREQVAALIRQTLAARGYGDTFAIAAISNGIRESDLNPLAVGDSGESVGVYQIRDRDYVNGKLVWRQFSGMREDPVYATQWIIDNEFGRESVRPFMDAARAGDHRLAASLFMQLVERPAERGTGGANWREAADIADRVKLGELPRSWHFNY